MKIQAFSATTLGQNRKSNEDAHLVDHTLGLYIVCDGSTGPGGEWAAKETISKVRELIAANKSQLDSFRKEDSSASRLKATKLLEKALENACAAVYQAGQSDLNKRGSFTTAEVLLSLGKFLILGHVGDSRTYLIRAGKLHRLTRDHTFLQDMIRDGGYDEADARRKPFSNNLTRAIGNAPLVQAEFLQFELAPGDTFIACTDGLSNFLNPKEILECARAFENSAVSDALIKVATKKGTTDNATTIVLEAIAEDASSEAVVPETATRAISPEALKAPRAVGTPSVEVFAKIEIIKTIPLFRHLAYAELLKVLALVHLRDVAAGVSFVKEGATSEEMFVVLNGGIAVTKKGEFLSQGGRGEVVGELGIFDNAPRSATVATTEASVLMVIERRELFSLMREDTALAVKLCWGIIQELSKRIRTHSTALAELRSTSGPAMTDLPFLEEIDS